MEEGAENGPEGARESVDLTAFGLPPDAIAERVNAVIAAAEAAAEGIKEDAEAEARTYLADSRQRAEELMDERARMIVDLTDSLIAQATSVKREFDSLMNAIEEGRGRLRELTPGARDAARPPRVTGEAAAPPPRPPAAPPAPLHREPEAAPAAPGPSRPAEPDPSRSAEPDPSRPPEKVPPTPGSDPAEGGVRETDRARLVAMQMAVSGAGRAEIADRLRREFGLTDPDPILDELARSVGL
jgi:hypothetical protein